MKAVSGHGNDRAEKHRTQRMIFTTVGWVVAAENRLNYRLILPLTDAFLDFITRTVFPSDALQTVTEVD